MIVDVRHDLTRMEARIGLLPRQRMAAAVRAMNRTMTTVRKEAVSLLREEYPGLKAKDIRTRLPIERAKTAQPVAAITFSGRRIALYGRFGMRARANRRGRAFGVAFRKGALPWRLETIGGEEVTPEMLARAFRNRSTRTGQPIVLTRLTKVRTSHEVLVAPGLARAFSERGVGRAVEIVLRRRWDEAFAQELKFQQLKAAGRV